MGTSKVTTRKILLRMPMTAYSSLYTPEICMSSQIIVLNEPKNIRYNVYLRYKFGSEDSEKRKALKPSENQYHATVLHTRFHKALVNPDKIPPSMITRVCRFAIGFMGLPCFDCAE
ncbi:hypothetical protein Zmor_007405 [Zophobas morio]|uniref:Uncharacterized protein n=1 Tax=Zophobas morio TaxID=2755281 RepID=A0AA38MNJ9_9CUCU|nr:hypothetical protein Zmor_007405 [Zophobas morio]